jgi:hypothetical protein
VEIGWGFKRRDAWCVVSLKQDGRCSLTMVLCRYRCIDQQDTSFWHGGSTNQSLQQDHGVKVLWGKLRFMPRVR